MYVLKAKSVVLAMLTKYKTIVERQLEHVMNVLRTNNDGKNVSKAFDEFLSQQGIAR